MMSEDIIKRDKLIKEKFDEESSTWYFKPNERKDRYSLTEDYLVLTRALVNIMSMYKDGEMIYYKTSEGLQTCGTDIISLARVLMKYLFPLVPVDIKVWEKAVRNIIAFLPESVQNETHIVFNNGSIDFKKTLRTRELEWMDELFRSDNKFDYNYIKDEKDLNPKALALYKEVMGNYLSDIKDEKAKEEWKRELLKITGYLLAPVNWLEKVFIFRSIPGTGKSLWLNIIKNIYKNNAAAYSPQAADQFAEVGIYKRRFIYTSELKGGRWTRQNEIQQLASGETFPVRMSGARVVEWKNPRVQILFLTNKKLTADKEDGIWDRFHLFEFITKIRGTKMNGESVLRDKTTSKAFIEVFIHFAMKGLADALKTGLNVNLELLNKELNSQDNVLNFLEDVMTDDEHPTPYIIRPLELFNAYKKWKKDTDSKNDNLTKKDFTYNMQQYINKPGHPKTRKKDNEPIHAWDLRQIRQDLMDKFNGVIEESDEPHQKEIVKEKQEDIIDYDDDISLEGLF